MRCSVLVWASNFPVLSIPSLWKKMHFLLPVFEVLDGLPLGYLTKWQMADSVIPSVLTFVLQSPCMLFELAFNMDRSWLDFRQIFCVVVSVCLGVFFCLMLPFWFLFYFHSFYLYHRKLYHKHLTNLTLTILRTSGQFEWLHQSKFSLQSVDFIMDNFVTLMPRINFWVNWCKIFKLKSSFIGTE